MDYGAALVSLVYKPLARECVCGFLTLEEMRQQSFYLGALVGRVANRIDQGRFSLNGTTYQLPINNGPHHLHGGPQGFNQAYYEVFQEADGLIYRHVSPHLDQGYPGKLSLEVHYHLDGPSLVIDLKAVSDQDTLCDPTLHTYFNLNPSHKDRIQNHQLTLPCQIFYGLSESGCTENKRLPSAEIMASNPSKIDIILKGDHPQLKLAKGIDHYFLKTEVDKPLVARLSVSDLILSVESTHPGAHIYSGNYLESSKILHADFLQENGGICFETHHVPNSINFDPSLAPILKANASQTSQTVYRFERVQP